jgi:hypothetical protein
MTDAAEDVARDLITHAMRAAVRLLGSMSARGLLVHIAKVETQKADCRERLDSIFSPAKAADWLRLPHPELAGKSPLDMIEAGGFDRVERLIIRLENDYQVRT